MGAVKYMVIASDDIGQWSGMWMLMQQRIGSPGWVNRARGSWEGGVYMVVASDDPGQMVGMGMLMQREERTN